jgi:hypothetical protein
MINFKSFYKFEAFKFRSGVLQQKINHLGNCKQMLFTCFKRKWQCKIYNFQKLPIPSVQKRYY